MAKTYVCSDCAASSTEPGDCRCGGGALLDIEDPAAVEMLVSQDDRVEEKVKQRNLWIGVGVGLFTVVAILLVVPKLILAIPLPIPFANPIKVVTLMILLAAGAMKVANVAMPAHRKFPQLRQAVAPTSAVARMRGPQRGTIVTVAVIGGFLVLVGVGVTVLRGVVGDDPKRLLGAKSGEVAEDDAPAGPKPRYRESDFGVVARGILNLRGMVKQGDKTGLLYRAPDGNLVLCVVEPDGAKSVSCDELRVPLRPQTARLVEGQSEFLVHGVTKMGLTPEETEYGAFRADGSSYDGDLEKLSMASDRPTLPPPSATWFSADLGGKKTSLTRRPSGELELLRAGDEPLIVMHDSDHGGPSTGTPMAFVGANAAVVIFQTKQGLSGLLVDPNDISPI
jgi:hypothetical protein